MYMKEMGFFQQWGILSFLQKERKTFKPNLHNGTMSIQMSFKALTIGLYLESFHNAVQLLNSLNWEIEFILYHM